MEWWQWAGLVISVAALILGYVYFRASQKPKKIYHEITANQALMSGRQGWGDLKVQFRDEPVEHPVVITVTFSNGGKVEAREDDFAEELGLLLGGGSKLISSYIVFKEAGGDTRQLEPSNSTSDRVTAPRMLLNVGDQLEFRLLVDGVRTTVVALGRVAGFKLEQRSSQSGRWGPLSSLFGSGRLASRRTVEASAFLAVGLIGLSASILGWVTAPETPELPAVPAIPAVEVPAIEGMTVDLAQQRLDEAGFEEVKTVLPAGITKKSQFDALARIHGSMRVVGVP